MRDTLEIIDGATDNDEDSRKALYILTVEVLAAQALSAANAHGIRVTEENARRIIEWCADYPGVTGRHIGKNHLGPLATERLLSLANGDRLHAALAGR